MNTDKTIHNKFISNVKEKYPIWYYKKLESIEVDNVIWNLLKESFVVEIDGNKHEITFGKNKNNEIGQCISYNDMRNSNTLCSYQVVQKGFREGKWFRITDKDTTDEFKEDYIRREEEYNKKNTKEMFLKIFKSTIDNRIDLTDEQKKEYKKTLENQSCENLKILFDELMEKDKKKE